MNRYPTHGLCELPVAILKVDPNVQGRFDQKWADYLADNWDPEQYGVANVSYRDGSYFVYNHQHVLAAARKLGVPTLRCYVRDGLSVQQEALGWLASNLVKAKSGADRFRLRLQALDEDAVEVQSTCNSIGIAIDLAGSMKPGTTKAVSTMTTLFQKGGRALLGNTLTVAQSAWPENPIALSATLLRGIGEFIWCYGGHPYYSQDRLTLALGRHDALAVRQQLSARTGGSQANHARDAVLVLYNYRLTTNAMPEITQSAMKRLSLGQNSWSKGLV